MENTDLGTVVLGSESKKSQYSTLSCSLFTKDVIFISLHTEEYIGGRIPFIHLVLSTTKEVAKLHQEVTFVIKNPTGFQIKFKGYIYELSYSQSQLDIKINGCPYKFITDYQSNKRSGLLQVIQDLNPFKLNVESGLTPKINRTPYYQNHESNWSHLSDSLFTYRNDVIWGYSLGELVIRGINPDKDWNNNNVYEYKFYRKGIDKEINDESKWIGCTPLSTHVISEPKRYGYDLKVLQNYKFFKVCQLGSQLFYIYPETKDLFTIKLHNMRLCDFRQSIEVLCRFIPQLRLGSKGLFRSDETADFKTFVSSRIIDIDVHEVKIHLKLESIDEVPVYKEN